MSDSDVRLLDPSRKKLLDALHKAIKAANFRRRVGRLDLDDAACERCADEVLAAPVGIRRLGNPVAPHGYVQPASFVGVAWWTDRVGRRHVRVASRRQDEATEFRLGQFTAPGSNDLPLALVEAEHVFRRHPTEGPASLLLRCDCGAMGTPEELGWMGGRCGPCHDFHEESGGDRVPPRPAVFAGHTAPILGVAFAAGDEVLVSAGADGDVQFGDLWQRRPRVVGRIEPRRVQLPVGFACNGRHAVLASFGGGLKWWDAATGRLLHEWDHSQRHFGYTCLALTPDGRRLAGSDFNTLEIWDTTDPAQPVRLREPGHVVEFVAFSSGGRRLAACRNRYELLSMIDTERNANVWAQSSRPANAAAFSPDGTLLAVAEGNLPMGWMVQRQQGNIGAVELLDADNGRAVATLYRDVSMRAVAFAPDGGTLAAGGEDHVIRFWELPSGRYLGGLEGHIGAVQALAFSGDGQLLASGGADGLVYLWHWREQLGVDEE
jgi:hypothetical protein